MPGKLDALKMILSRGGQSGKGILESLGKGAMAGGKEALGGIKGVVGKDPAAAAGVGAAGGGLAGLLAALGLEDEEEEEGNMHNYDTGGY